MTSRLEALTWPAEELAPALEALAAAAGLGVAEVRLPPAPATPLPDGDWLETAGTNLGLEVEEVSVRYHELDDLVLKGGPALLPVTVDGDARLLLLLARRRRKAEVLGPDLRSTAVSSNVVREALAAPLEGPFVEGVEAVLDHAGVPPRRRPRSRRAMLAEHLGARSVGPCWILRPLPGSSFPAQLVGSGQVAGTVALLLCHLLQTGLFLTAWWLVGRGALAGTLDLVWLAGWGLILLTLVPLRMLIVFLQGRVVLGVGVLLKRRLLAGVLKLDLEEIKHEGAGMLLGRVLESNALEGLVLSGGYRTMLAVVEIAATVWVLAHGAGGGWHALLFVAWLGLTLVLAWRYWTAIDGWTTARLALTHDLAERMVGHRTRLAQQSPDGWHRGEDELLERYLEAAGAMDRAGPWVAQASHGWRLVGLLGLVGPFAAGTASVPALAVSLGGLLLGNQALAGFSSGLQSLAVAAIGWRRVAPIFHAAAAPEQAGSLLPTATGEVAGTAVVSAHDVSYSYPGRDRRAVSGADFVVRRGDRLLVLGPSGGGKSTLVALLSALRRPSAGLVLCHGLDLPTLGERCWRQTVAAAPQFNDNHVLTETFAFNLLMGRRWPPTAADLAEAEEVCRELGLGELLERMPSGMMQMVGDTGWQLSHGEQSRLFVARALLQDAALVILDESFGALDPVNLKRAVDCARRRAETLAVVAHP